VLITPTQNMSARVGRFENRAIGCTRLWRVLNEIVAPNLPRDLLICQDIDLEWVRI